MGTQGKLFEYEGNLSYRQIWDLTKNGITDAANDLIDLLNEATNGAHPLPITIVALAQRRIGLARDTNIPPELVEVFHAITHQLYDQRHSIKSKVEELTEYRLVSVDEDGLGTLGRGRRSMAGFNLRDSEVGIQDDAVQLRLSQGKSRKLLRRHPDWLPHAVRELVADVDIKQIEPN